MKKVITYGTFDLFHEGHYRLLKQAKELGDYLIVGVTTENFDKSRGKLNVQESLMKRIENVKECGLADDIIIEEYFGQKIHDIQKYNIDIFAIGSDWKDKFDYLKEYCQVIYLERTKGISSTKLRAEYNGIIQMGVVGCGKKSIKFIQESKFVSGLHIKGIYGENREKLETFVDSYELDFCEEDFDCFLDKVDAFYIDSCFHLEYEYLERAIKKGKHILYENMKFFTLEQIENLNHLASIHNCVLLESVYTAFLPGFIQLVCVAKSGLIGEIKNIDVTYTKLMESKSDGIDRGNEACSFELLSSYPLLAIVKLLGREYEDYTFHSFTQDECKKELFTKLDLKYKHAIATAKVGVGVLSVNDLIITGTKGYIYVPDPWWETQSFEIRFKDVSQNKKYYYNYEGESIRYEIAEFLSMINKNQLHSYKFWPEESKIISDIISRIKNSDHVYCF